MDIRDITIQRNISLHDALLRMDKAALGLLLLVHDNGTFERTVTDGDLRRLLLEGVVLDQSLAALPKKQSVVATIGTSRREALDIMNRCVINHLPVVDKQGFVTAILDRKDIDEQILLSTPHIGDSEREFVEDAFRSNWIAPLGPNVDAFEAELAKLVGIKHAAAVSSGTAAIHLALRLLGVKTGDRVFCSTLTFVASASPIIYQGAQPIFIDSDELSWNMSPAALERAFSTAKNEGWMPKAVIVVNLYGQSADIDPLIELCNRYRVPMLEDAAESLGALYKGRHSGTFGSLGVYSFNGNKIITTSGGGMLVSDDENLIKRARFLSTQARDPAPHYQHSEVGYNYRMSNILAGIGRGQLKVLRDRVEARRKVYETYRAELTDMPMIQWMPEPDWSYSNRWLSAATISPEARVTSAQLIQQLAGEMIEARPIWKPMHMQPVFAQCRYFTSGNASISDDLFNRGICLPSGSNMTGAQIDRVIKNLRSHLR